MLLVSVLCIQASSIPTSLPSLKDITIVQIQLLVLQSCGYTEQPRRTLSKPATFVAMADGSLRDAHSDGDCY